VRLVVEALVIRKSVDDPVDVKKFVEVALPAKKLVVEAFVAAKLLVAVALVTVRDPIVPVVEKSVATVPTVVEEVLRTV
jgi:hypothetical protein